MSLDLSRTVIVMPAFNEAESLADVIAETRTTLPGVHIAVVDDGSKDATAEVARASGAVVLELPFNLGVGGAMRAGFVYAREAGFDNVVQLDSDGQHDPKYVLEMLSQLGESDIVIGARFAGEGDYSVGGPRRWAMVALSATLSAICRTRLTDTTSGFKAMGPRAIALFSEHFPAEYLGDTIEALIIAKKNKLVMSQIPVAMRVRAAGQPSQSSWKSTIYLGRAFIALFVGLTRKRS